VRTKLREAVDDDYRNSPPHERELATCFNGYCGLSQCIAGYYLQDIGVPVMPLATQSLPGWIFGHAALTVRIASGNFEKVFLVDPTFVQFTAVKIRPSPLFEGQTGEFIKKRLVEAGYIELTPVIAAAYLSAFCGGKAPFSTAEEAYSFCANPPPHEFHYRHSPDNDWFSRENLAMRGQLLGP
jgi:hypothetical protein